MTLYRLRIFGDDGTTWMQTGEAVTIGGSAFVRLGCSDMLTPRAGGWHESEADAIKAKADDVQAMADKLAAKAARMREGMT
jgi:hypothetical protein